MKNFKTKILALVICLCMCLSVLTGCSLVVKDTKKENAKTAITIGDTVITREELIEDYNRFYQQVNSQNYYYFMYNDPETIVEDFYNSVVANKIILLEAEKLVADETLVITDEDMQGVWDKVFDYVYGQVDSYEKSILSLAGTEEKDYPARLQKEETDATAEKAYKYEPYEFEEVSVLTASGTSFDPENFKTDDEIEKIKEYVLKYNAGDDENKDMVAIADAELKTRKQAYNEFIADLQFAAKANKKDSSQAAVLKAEVERVYKSYYESMLYTKYQEYINSTIAGVAGKYENKFSDEAIAEKYRKLLDTSKESNTVENDYVELIYPSTVSTSSSSDDVLLLYHNEEVGDVYFTVQHILVKFDDETLKQLEETAGYDVTKDAMLREYYEQVRASIANADFVKNMETSYRDEDGYLVKEDDGTGAMVESKVKVGADTDTAEANTIYGKYKNELATRLAELTVSDEYAAMSAEDKTLAEQRVKTLLFQEFSWRYSEDVGSLSNDLSGVQGFTINNNVKENGTLVKEFTNGARTLLTDTDSDGLYDVGEKIISVVSDYGVHLMMLTGVYEKGAVVSKTKPDGTAKTDAELVDDLKKAYISNLTTESLYQYIYDLIKDELVGDNGTYFTDHKNELVKQYKDAGKIKYLIEMSYEDLNKAISG